MNSVKPFTARIPANTLNALYELQRVRSDRERHRIPIYFLIADALERYIFAEMSRLATATPTVGGQP